MSRMVRRMIIARLGSGFLNLLTLLAVLSLLIGAERFSSLANAAPGDVLRTITVNPLPQCLTSPGIAFDGSELLVSCSTTNVITRVNPANGSVTGSITVPAIPVSEGIGALSWDATNGQLWIGTGNALPQKVYTAALNKAASTGTATLRFTHGEGGLSIIAGLAFDPTDGTMWLVPDQSPTVYHYTQAGVLINTFDVGAQFGIEGATGVAVGDATTLFLGNNGTGEVFSSTKGGGSFVQFATLTDEHVMDLECDPVTFAPRKAIWVKNLFDFNLNAFEAPPGQCSQSVPTPTPLPTPTGQPTPLVPPVSAADAKLEIVFPHDAAGNPQPVTEATLANVGAFLFFPGTLNPVPCGFSGQVRLFRSLNANPDRFVAFGTPRLVQQSGRNITIWEWNDVDVSEAIDPVNKYYFTLSIDGVPTSSNVWSHGEDARTIFPEQDVPTGVASLGPEIDAKIEVVFPHDAAGTPTSVVAATQVNIAVDVFSVGTLESAPPDANLTVRLFRSLNNDPQREVAVGQRTIVTRDGVTHPRWVFNDIDVSAAQDPINKYYFRARVDGFISHSNTWAHGADARTIFPQIDTPTASCQ